MDKYVQKYEVIWSENNLLNCKEVVCEGKYVPLVIPEEIQSIMKILIEKKYSYYIYFLGDCKKVEQGHIVPEAHCAWYNKNNIGDCIL